MTCPEEKIWEIGKRVKFLWQPQIPGLGKPVKPLSLQVHNVTVSLTKKHGQALLEFLRIIYSKSWEPTDLPKKKKWNHKGRK